jgi:hypothetical protein
LKFESRLQSTSAGRDCRALHPSSCHAPPPRGYAPSSPQPSLGWTNPPAPTLAPSEAHHPALEGRRCPPRQIFPFPSPPTENSCTTIILPSRLLSEHDHREATAAPESRGSAAAAAHFGEPASEPFSTISHVPHLFPPPHRAAGLLGLIDGCQRSPPIRERHRSRHLRPLTNTQ